GLRAIAVDAQPSLAGYRSRWLAEHSLYRPGADHQLKGAEAWRGTRYVADLATAAPELQRRLPLALEVRVRGLALLPLRAGDRFEGTLTVAWHAPLTDVRFDRETLELAGQYLAVALGHGRLHAEMERQRAMSQSILGSMGEGVVVADLEGMVIYRNPAADRITGHVPDPSRPLTEQAGMYALR